MKLENAIRALAGTFVLTSVALAPAQMERRGD